MKSLRPHERGLHRAPNREGWTALKILVVIVALVGAVVWFATR